MKKVIVIFNAGSSSLKFSLFAVDGCSLLFHGIVDDLQGNPVLKIYDAEKSLVYLQDSLEQGYKAALAALFNWDGFRQGIKIVAVGHRVVHGGKEFSQAIKVNSDVLIQLEELIPLAPLHQPYNLATIKEYQLLHPDVPQVACFDTAFHRTQLPESEYFAIPQKYYEDGILRYGFHGLSYEYIASVLPEYAGKYASGKVIVAHLGNGASMCAIKNGQSVATTMGFTALDGLIMGTRCGNIDPGVILYLMEEKGMSLSEVTNLLYKESGLKALSEISNDMRVLLESDDSKANFAIEMFCYQAAKQLAGLIPSLGGLDVLVFTAGIGEGAAKIRQNICKRLEFLGVVLNEEENLKNHSNIHSKQSKVGIYVIPTNEELVIARHTLNML